MWSGERLPKIQATTGPGLLWPDVCGPEREKQLNEKNSSNVPWRSQSSTMRESLRGIYFIDPEDKELKEAMKKRAEKMELPVETAMPGEVKNHQYRETCGESDNRKSKHACIVEARESERESAWKELYPKIMNFALQERGINSLSHYNPVQKFIPMHQAMKIHDAKAAVNEKWEMVEKLPAWQMARVKSKREVMQEAQKEQRTVHFAMLMDSCHLKNVELEPKFQMYRGRVVLRGDIVKDDSGSHAAFTEQGSSASQMTAAKSNGCPSKATRMPRTTSRRSVSLHPSQNEGGSRMIETSKVRMSRYLITSTTTQVAKILVEHRRPSGSS